MRIRPAQSPNNRGIATIVVVVLLVVMVLLIGANSHALNNLARDLRRIEAKQLRASVVAATNAVAKPATNSLALTNSAAATPESERK